MTKLVSNKEAVSDRRTRQGLVRVNSGFDGTRTNLEESVKEIAFKSRNSDLHRCKVDRYRPCSQMPFRTEEYLMSKMNTVKWIITERRFTHGHLASSCTSRKEMLDRGVCAYISAFTAEEVGLVVSEGEP